MLTQDVTNFPYMHKILLEACQESEQSMKIGKNLISCWRRINVMDKYLILIMGILFLYSVSTIFTTYPGQDVGNIDTIVRTTTASIFGYFISSNFIKSEVVSYTSNIAKDSAASSSQPTEDSSDKDVTITSTDGSAEKKIAEIPAPVETETIKHSYNELQVNIVGIFCVLALLTLFSVRVLFRMEVDSVEPITQLRDIVCGSIGFLIGIPSDSLNNK